MPRSVRTGDRGQRIERRIERDRLFLEVRASTSLALGEKDRVLSPIGVAHTLRLHALHLVILLFLCLVLFNIPFFSFILFRHGAPSLSESIFYFFLS